MARLDQIAVFALDAVPEARGRERRLEPIVQYFVARGFGVFQPNYLGSTGYGRAFAAGGHGVENPSFHLKHATAMTAALRAAGRSVVSLRCDGATETFLDDRGRIDFHTRLGDFFEQHLTASRTQAGVVRDSNEQALRRLR